MKVHKTIIFGLLFSFLTGSTVFAIEPLQIDPDLIRLNTFDTVPLLELQPVEPLPGEDPYTDDPAIITKLRGGLNDDGTVSLKWDIYTGPNFLWYKIIKSNEKKELIYPKDGYIDYYDTPNATVWDDDSPALGSNYYRVCIITTDNKRGCSNQIEVVMEKSVQPETTQPKEDIQPQKDATVQKPEATKGGFLKALGQFINEQAQVLLGILALILAATGFTFAAKRKQRSIAKYINEIDNTYSEFKMKSKRCEAELYRLRDIIDEQLKSGKLDEGAYQLLMNRIEGYMVEIQKQIVNEKFGGLPENLKNELFNMMESGDISEKEYEKFQTLINKSELSGNEQSTLLKTVKDFQAQGEKLKRKGAKEN
jgi:hypothetical protein